jgi:hypothetical protein
LNKIEQRTVIGNLKQRPKKEEKERENYDRKKKKRKANESWARPIIHRGTRRHAQTPQQAVYRVSRMLGSARALPCIRFAKAFVHTGRPNNRKLLLCF